MPTWLATKRRKQPPQNPRKPLTGTSYQSQGLIPPTPTLGTEDGSSNVPPLRDIVPELQSAFQRQLVYRRMLNDMGVDLSMRVYKTPVLGAEFYVEPYDSLPQNMEIAAFIEDNLFGGMSSPFTNAKEDILHFFEDGYAVLEKVYEVREWTPPGQGRNTKNYNMLQKLAVRPPSTIQSINYDDNGGPNGVTHNAIDAQGNVNEVDIDISKLLIFTHGRIGGDLTGRSLMRTAYEHWYYKRHLYKIDAIQKERHAIGVPRGKLLPGSKSGDKKILRSMLRNLRTNEESMVIQTPGVEVDFIELTGQLVNVLESAEHHNFMILMNVMAQFLALGSGGQSGGRTSAGAQTDIFSKALRYVADLICETFNMYLIPELVVWNYPTRSFPKLRARNIGEVRDLQMFAAAVGNLLSQNGITMDLPTENFLRRVFDMPLKDAASAPDYASFYKPTTFTANGTNTPVQGSQQGGGTPTNNGKGGVAPNAIKPGNTGKPPNAPN